MEKYTLALALINRPGRYATRENPQLVPGDHVKVGFRIPPGRGAGNEWMFLEVTAVEGQWPNAAYRGELLNTPWFFDPAELCIGQPVEFRGEHIFEAIHDSPERSRVAS